MGIQIQNAIFLGSAKPGSGSGGGAVDYTKVVSKTKTMPTAGADNLNIIYLYEGETDANYTHGYVYENHKTATYTGTVSFEAATLSGTTVACSGDDFAVFLATYMTNITDITQGTITYIQAADLWRIEGKNSGGETVDSFQVYQEDYELAGFTFTGTPQDGDVVSFSCSVEEDAVSYAWVRFNVQPGEIPSQTGQSGKFLTTNGSALSWGTVGGLPSQSGNSGKFLTTDGTDASWGNALALDSDGYIPVVSGQSNVIKMYNANGSYGGDLLTLFDRSGGSLSQRFKLSYYRSWETSSDRGAAGFSFSWAASVVASLYISGKGLVAYKGAGSLSSTFDLGASNHMFDTTFTKKLNNGSAIDVPNVAGTMVVATPPSADGTYVLKATVADGVVTYTWVAE